MILILFSPATRRCAGRPLFALEIERGTLISAYKGWKHYKGETGLARDFLVPDGHYYVCLNGKTWYRYECGWVSMESCPVVTLEAIDLRPATHDCVKKAELILHQFA